MTPRQAAASIVAFRIWAPWAIIGPMAAVGAEARPVTVKIVKGVAS